ncbi:jerky-like protein [Trichonephila clavipes]|nr:jerky-like protein [Trichonephila clavipes]
MKRKTTREANDILLDRALYLWFSQRRSKEDLISVHLLCEKAPELDEKLGGSADFKASTGFKARTLNHAMGYRNCSGGEGYSRDDDNNVDEIGVNWKALPRKSLSSKRDSTAPGFKVSKEHVTTMVCSNANGKHSFAIACDWQI